MFDDTIRLGTVRGIRIGVHWSVLFVASLLAWGLAANILPAAAPGAMPAAYWVAGAGVAVVFFASLLAHELAHAYFATRAGVRVEGITLWLLGGVAKLDGDAPTPGHDLRIAASGPITSGLLGLLFWGLALALGTAAAAPLLTESALWLARVNLVLALFNLLPGAPLDGGRIVRALAWRTGRDRLRASLLATRLGRIIGYGLVVFGVFELVAGTDVGGLWTIVLGLFLATAASAESSHEVARSALDGLRVEDVMARDPVRVPAGISVDVFTGSVLAPQRLEAALVVEAGGIVTGVAGVSEAAALRGPARRDRRVRDIALPLAAIPRARPDEDLLAVMERVASGVDAAAATAPWGGAGRPSNPGYLLVVMAAGVADGQAGVDRPTSIPAVPEIPLAPPPPPWAAVTDGTRIGGGLAVTPGPAGNPERIVGLVTPADLVRTVEARSLSAAARREAGSAG